MHYTYGNNSYSFFSLSHSAAARTFAIQVICTSMRIAGGLLTIDHIQLTATFTTNQKSITRQTKVHYGINGLWRKVRGKRLDRRLVNGQLFVDSVLLQYVFFCATKTIIIKEFPQFSHKFDVKQEKEERKYTMIETKSTQKITSSRVFHTHKTTEPMCQMGFTSNSNALATFDMFT